MQQIQIEIDKNTKEIQVLKILCSFCVILESLKISKTVNKEQIGCQEGFF